MSFEETNRFLTEFNNLDKILKDMYQSDVPSKLGVTRYLEAMKESYAYGCQKVMGWDRDFEKLKHLRNTRNEAVHENRLGEGLFDSSDTAWIKDFRIKVINRTDPLSLLGKSFKKATPKTEVREKTNLGEGLVAGLVGILFVILIIVVLKEMLI